MSDRRESKELIRFRDYCRERAEWQRGELRQACKEKAPWGSLKTPDHANCGGDRCGCTCHEPTDRDRELFRSLADEIDAFIEPSEPEPDLFANSP